MYLSLSSLSLAANLDNDMAKQYLERSNGLRLREVGSQLCFIRLVVEITNAVIIPLARSHNV